MRSVGGEWAFRSLGACQAHPPSKQRFQKIVRTDLKRFRLGCLKPIQIVYVPTVNTPSKKCPDLPYVDTDTNEAKCELNTAVYYHGIMSVNINWKELCSGIRNICRVKYHSPTRPAVPARTLQPWSFNMSFVTPLVSSHSKPICCRILVSRTSATVVSSLLILVH